MDLSLGGCVDLNINNFRSRMIKQQTIRITIKSHLVVKMKENFQILVQARLKVQLTRSKALQLRLNYFQKNKTQPLCCNLVCFPQKHSLVELVITYLVSYNL